MHSGEKTITDVGGGRERRGEVEEKESSSASLWEDIDLERYLSELIVCWLSEAITLLWCFKPRNSQSCLEKS